MRDMRVSIRAGDDAQFEADLDENMREGHVTPEYWPLLQEVAERGTPGMLQVLRSHGFDFCRMLGAGHAGYDNGWPGDDSRPLHHAAFWGRVEICRILLEAGCDPDSRDADGATPLMATVWHYHAPVAALLLDSGADVNAMDSQGWTALAWSAGEGGPDVASLLLQRGADPNLRFPDGESPLHRAARSENFPLIALLRAHGAVCDDFHTAVLLGETEIVERFLTASTDRLALATAVDPHGTKTPLCAAVRGGDVGVVRALLAAGADPNESEGAAGGETLLMRAAATGHTEVVQELLRAGADPNARIQREGVMYVTMTATGVSHWIGLLRGMTALDLARWVGQIAVADLLREYGAVSKKER